MKAPDYGAVFRDRNLAAILLLGFSSGLPLYLTGPTLQAWMTVEGIDLSTIGVFTLVGLPYTWKFLWAPSMDRFVPPFLGRRRGWLLITQVALIAGIGAMGFCPPRTMLGALGALAVFVAVASASHDIVVDAYRADVTTPEERGLAAAFGVIGYRIAMLVSGALALAIVAGSAGIPGIGWTNTYVLMAALMGIGIAGTLMGAEPVTAAPPPRTLADAVWQPLREFFGRPGAGWTLLLIVLYKLGDAFAGSLTTAFLLRGVGFSLAEVGLVNKAAGLAATIVGLVVGGTLMVRLGLYRSLMVFGVALPLSILAYMLLAIVGHNFSLMVFAVSAENLVSGMGTAAFVALLMALCDRRFTATQYALLSALSAFGRVYVGPVAGFVTDPKYLGVDWATFFFVAALTCLPGLALLHWRRTSIPV